MIDWLVSYPKSGNTWVRALVAAYLRDEDVDLGCMIGSESDTGLKWFQILSPMPLTAVSDEEKMMLRHAGLYNIYMSVRPPTLLKTHATVCALYHVPLFVPTFINKVFYIARDPRDVVISLADHTGRDIDTAIDVMNNPGFVLNGSGIMPSPIGSWSNHYMSWAKFHKDIHLLRYEDLISDPIQTFTNFLEHWGVKVNAGRVERAVARTEFSLLQDLEETAVNFNEKSKHSERFFRKGKAGGWKDVLTKKQAKKIETQHKDTMMALGYG